MNLRKIADIVVLIIIGFCLGGMFSDVSATDQYLSEWQTLIAGILAVAAAAWTVGEMRRNDSMQQQRHEELMLLNLRADRLRAERAAFPYADKLEYASNIISERVEQLGAHRDIDINRRVAINIAQAMNFIIDYLRADAIIDAKPLFGSAMAFSFESLEKRIEISARTTIGLCETLAETETDFGKKLEEHWPKIALNSLTIARSCREFAVELKRLADHYGPD
ncbi:hypothetical protein ACFFTN_19900 [Aminobacter aganoensis]|uniref:Uncharacterized protein n=1 Tax=Aminobacter aganoensis TaxID=83264 RepID=A0A7X0KI89_9HYPH|nr:hypothetical protein [Aminobacter aganoensis]MBB6352485.1 hypothetical protein [Aminobacter aganoensis]